MLSKSLVALSVASAIAPTLAQKAGSFADAGNTKVSAMMMFLGNLDSVYISDKVEGNAEQIDGHPAWHSRWDFKTHKVDLMKGNSNAFCAAGMHLPNGSFVTFGGNGAIAPGGNIGSVKTPDGYAGSFDEVYGDHDGRKSIRMLSPCASGDNLDDAKCQWYDDPNGLAMQETRWYPAAEPLADGSVVLIGGFANGGYINRNYPNVDPAREGGAAIPTFEFYPPNGRTPEVMDFMVKTSGLNSYAHTYLMPSGKMFIQANLSTILWDPANNKETPLPDMPNGVARVYPASGAAAMLPLTPENNYNPTVIFCGGSDLPDYAWGNYSWPFVNTFDYHASKDCQRITPEPEDGSAPKYVQDDDMLEGRTMGQFITLPDGKLLVVNGGKNGTAGYSERTLEISDYGNMPFGMSLASDPAGTPAIYDPKAEKGKRWANTGFDTSKIARLYHSSAILLPDASVLIAGSNPNVDVNLTTVFPTEYRAEIFYPPYFSASTRPEPSGLPNKLSYGGDMFEVTVPASSYSGSANDAADNTQVVLVRGGWTTHAMNMGQRMLQLKNTYTVNQDGSLTLHVSQLPPKPEIFQPGPTMVFVVINGIPSKASWAIVGTGNIEKQPTGAEAKLPNNVRLDGAKGGAAGSTTGNQNNGNNNNTNGASRNVGALVGGIVGAIAVIGLLG